MKKHMLALAVMAAVAGPVAAQVTVSGAYGNGLIYTATNKAAAVQSMGGAAIGTPNITLSGTEDLGGGMKAYFSLQSTLGANGSLGYTNPTTGGSNVFDRLAFAGISGGFGALAIGRQNDAVKDIEGLSALTNLIDGTNFTQVGDRYTNVVKYTSPAFSGFTVSGSFSENATGSSGSDAGSSTTTITNSGTINDGTQLRSYNIRGAVSGIQLAAAYGAMESVTGVETTTTRLSGQTAVGSATVGLSYTKNNTSATATRDNTLVSAMLPLGGGLNVYASFANDKSDDATTDGSAMTAMLSKDFSKRTTAYVGYSSVDRKTAASDVVVTTVGLIHRF